MTALVGNLGGTAGFGEFSLPANDDGSTGFIDLRTASTINESHLVCGRCGFVTRA